MELERFQGVARCEKDGKRDFFRDLLGAISRPPHRAIAPPRRDVTDVTETGSKSFPDGTHEGCFPSLPEGGGRLQDES